MEDVVEIFGVGFLLHARLLRIMMLNEPAKRNDVDVFSLCSNLGP